MAHAWVTYAERRKAAHVAWPSPAVLPRHVALTVWPEEEDRPTRTGRAQPSLEGSRSVLRRPGGHSMACGTGQGSDSRGRLGDAFCLGSSSGGGAEVEKTVSVGEGPLESPALDATEKQLAVGVGAAAGRGSGVRSRKGTPGVRGHLCTACRSLVACR